MEEYKIRLLEEIEDLEEKIDKLDEFISSESFHEDIDTIQQDLLIAQINAMNSYYGILHIRINLLIDSECNYCEDDICGDDICGDDIEEHY